MSDFLTITNTNEFVRFTAESLVYISSDGNYSDIHTRDGGKRTIIVQLGNIEELIHQQFLANGDNFVRIGKSLIVNLHFVHYIHPMRRQLILSDNHTFKFTLEASKEALRKLKDYLENANNK